MRFGFITLGGRVPSTRFRFLPYLPLLRQRGHRCLHWLSRPSVYEHYPWFGWRLSHLVKRAVRSGQLLQSAVVRPNAIYLERGCLNDDSLDLDRLFRRTTTRLVLDVDDGIFLERPEKVDRLIAMSDHIVASNALIAEYVSARHPRVTILPTCVELRRYRLREPPPDRMRPVIGWMGTLPNMPFLAECAAALRELARRHPFQLLVVGPSAEPLRELDLTGVDVQFEGWKPELEIQHLHRMDIGLMPLPDGQEWMRYKAATKLIQYLSVGIPAVASPIGVNAQILADNRVGFAARSTDQWLQRLEELIANPSLRQQMGLAGRALVEREYSIEANIDRLERVLCGTDDR